MSTTPATLGSAANENPHVNVTLAAARGKRILSYNSPLRGSKGLTRGVLSRGGVGRVAAFWPNPAFLIGCEGGVCLADVPSAMSWMQTFLVKTRRWPWKASRATAPVQLARVKETVICIGCVEDGSILDRVLEAGSYDVSFIASSANAYAQIVRTLPSR